MSFWYDRIGCNVHLNYESKGHKGYAVKSGILTEPIAYPTLNFSAYLNISVKKEQTEKGSKYEV